MSTVDPEKWTRERAEREAQKLRIYWRDRGFEIDVWVEPVSQTYKTDFAVRSNIAKLPGLVGQARPNDSLQAESNLSDERHEAEDTTPKDTP